MVDMRQQLPPEWAERAERRGLSPSATAIAKAAGLATSTVTRMLAGRFSSTASINAVAKVLGVKPSVIADEVGVRIHSELGMWEPPKEAHQLGGAERDVLNRLIGVLAKGEDDAGRPPKAEKTPTLRAVPGEPPLHPDEPEVEEDPYMRPAARKGTLIPPADD